MSPSKLISKLEKLLVTISQQANNDFSGLGVIIYNDLNALAPYHCNLVDGSDNLPNITIEHETIIDYLLMISNHSHHYHDGFHFFDSQGKLTHVAQFVSPPLKTNHLPPGQHGARTYCARQISLIKGVVFVGMISSNAMCYSCNKGEIIEINPKHADTEEYDSWIS